MKARDSMEFIDAKLASELVAGTDRLDPKEIEALAAERLKYLVNYARAHSPYLREKYACLPEDFSLCDLPVSTRTEMVEHFNEWVCDSEITSERIDAYLSDFENLFEPFLGKYSVLSTSGTTSAPLRVVRDARHNAVHGALMAHRYFHGPLLRDVADLDKPDLKQCAIIAPSGINSSYISFERLRRSYEARGIGDRALFLSTLMPVEQLVKQLNAFQPDIIGCYPSIIYTLAFEQKEGRLHIHPLMIGCSAEKLPEQNRRFISEAFGCPVNDNYCSTEGGEVAMLCPNGHMHINRDWVIVEPVDADNRPVPCGVQSDGILMTNLACLAQPVIRYRMSDRIILHDEPCGCSLTTPWLEIEGRVEDILIFDKGNEKIRIPGILFCLYTKDIPGIDHCQAIQRAPDAIELRISTMTGHDHASAAEAAEACIRNLLDQNKLEHVRITLVDLPPARTKSGKFRIAFKEFA